MYYGARYYDAAIGRFAQPDSIVPNPYNPQSLNRYSYVLNNPVRYTDPTGRCIPEECGSAYGDVDDIYVDTQLNDSSGGDDTAAKTGGEQNPAGSPDEKCDVPCYKENPKAQVRPGSRSWLDYYTLTGYALGANATLSPIPNGLLPGPLGQLFPGVTGGAEVIANNDDFIYHAPNLTTMGLFGYGGPTTTYGAGANVVGYASAVVNYDLGTPGSFSGGAMSYQVSVSVFGAGIEISDTVVDQPSGEPNGPLAPGVPQMISAGYAPGAKFGLTVSHINEAPILGLCGGPRCW